MLDNTITLPVDQLANDVLVDESFTRFDEFQNRAVYVGPGHSLSKRNTLTTYRTLPKKSGNFNGVGKSAAKFTQDFEVPGVDLSTTVIGSGIVDISTSFAVGMTDAECMGMRQRAIAFLDHAIATRAQEGLEY